ncbi:extracellular solute-binding protein [Paeniglutamicibacter antarcticus]|uniref:Extracellular solute-binding protein n=1 Tax=Arthrobacter terrae TaxID=2935737 RepID=A0A931CS01_9MICC|nr:extracellular solute-binding protein [Arthrobacter terrae]MBG0738578.1 extracellular solute-binding protein [Arthrobacter terrae]
MIEESARKRSISDIQAAFDRRIFMRGALLAGTSLAGIGALSGCGSSSGSSGSSDAKGTVPVESRPSYYPSDYDSIVEGSKAEKKLTIYSNMAEYNWKPISDAFTKLYPWMTVSTNNLDSAEVFQKYYAESASGTSPAALMVSGDPTSWIDFINKKSASDYKSPETDKLPDFGHPLPGLYTFSADPILMGYNKTLLKKEQYPTGLASLVKLVESDPGKFKNKITTYDVENSFGYAIEYSWANARPDSWDTLDKLLPFVRAEQSSGPMVEKINSGEYLAGFFLSSTVVIPQAEKTGAILGWGYIDDGMPIFLRGMAIPKTSPTPNAAKLMLDFLLSHSGQIAVYNGGFTPYRSDITDEEAPRNYNSIVKKVGGKDKIVTVGYDPITDAQAKEFKAKWKSGMGK